MNTHTSALEGRAPWNKGKLVGQKAPLRISEVWLYNNHLQESQHFQISVFRLPMVTDCLGPLLAEICRRRIIS